MIKKVSVIIPVHNTEQYLSTCLNSVVNQTEEKIEIICINDHSKDHSLEILKNYEKQYPYKMKVIDMLEKKGVSSARNEGLKIAQGEYIGFVDSDDLISLNMYHDFYRLAKEREAKIVVGNCFRIRNNDFLKNETFITKDSFARKRNYLEIPRYLIDETPAVWDKLFSHDLIGDTKFLENHIYEDVGFTYYLLIKAKESLEFIRDDYAYRITKGSIMNNKEIRREIIDIIFVCYDALKKAKESFSKKQLTILEDILKIHIYGKIDDILKWPLEFKIRRKWIESYLSIANFYIENILNLNTMYANFLEESKIAYIKENYNIYRINEKKINYETESLKRAIIKQKKNT